MILLEKTQFLETYLNLPKENYADSFKQDVAIYFNEDFKCFIMVQYKTMEKEGDKFVFRLPNLQFTEEISRMDSIIQSLKSTNGNGFIHDYRFNENPFFVKILGRIDIRFSHSTRIDY